MRKLRFQEPTSMFWWLWHRVVLIAFLCLSLVGCSKTIDFREDVLLSDGTTIEIHRAVELRRSCEGLSCDWALDQTVIRIDDSKNTIWSKRLSPLLLDKYKGKYFLVATTIYCNDKEFGRPNPDYIQFELTPSGWERVELSSNIYERQANLLIAPDWYAGEPKKIDILTKESRNKIAGVRGYKKVLTPVTPNNC